jgi:lipopolysaccharide biosynthesis glycosyltransferase
MISASQRWNCKFYEMTENLVGSQNVCFNKVVGIKDYWSKHPEIDRILYIDSDILIRNDTPNPFELFNDCNYIYAVKDVYADIWDSNRLEEYRRDVIDPWVMKVHHTLKYDVDINEWINTYPKWFFNAGMFIITPKNHINEINLFIDNIPIENVHGRIEQAMWNYILKYSDKVRLIGYEWNYINPDISDGNMKHYIYHFTGKNWILLKQKLPTYNWKI